MRDQNLMADCGILWCTACAFGNSLWVLNISVTYSQLFTASSQASWLNILFNPEEGGSS